MKKSTILVHAFIDKLGLDNFMAEYASAWPLLRKFVPEPFEYHLNAVKTVRRDGVIFELFVYDYMQWFVFANMPDNAWRYALNRVLLDEASVVLDVGANVGAFSLKLARGCIDGGLSNVKIVSFEPNPSVFQRLQHNIGLNQELKSIVSTETLALGATQGVVGMTFEQENTGHGRISEPQGANVSIEMTTLDNFIEDSDFQRLDFLKIDVEGYEPFVVDGGLGVIEQYKPDIYIEITEQWFSERGRSSKELFETLRSFGYQLFYDDIDKLFPLDKKTDSLPMQFNILASSNGQ